MRRALGTLGAVLALAAGAEERLARETSPYLRDHAGGAVEWHVFGDEAFDEARRRQRLVFVLVGRFGCARCAALEAGLLGEPGTLALVGRRFVSVIVDRDERPDVAMLYGAALEVLTEGRVVDAGDLLWLVMTPEGGPVAADAPADATAASGFRARALGIVADAENKPAEIRRWGEATAVAARELLEPGPPGPALGPQDVQSVRRRLMTSLDEERWIPPRRLPGLAGLRLLLREGGGEAVRVASGVLETLAVSDLWDDASGGFLHEALVGGVASRRLADNAVLLRSYASAYALTGRPTHREVASAIASWALRELRGADGAFWSAVETGQVLPGGRRIDDRVMAGENGLMIGALVTTAAATGRAEDLEAARRAAAAVLERLGPARSLKRCARGSALCGPAFLDDYAYLAEGLLDLHDATGEARWRAEAAALADEAVLRFVDPLGGGFFFTERIQDRTGLGAFGRFKVGSDGRLPSPNGVMASVLLRLSRATGQGRYVDLARRTVEAFRGSLRAEPHRMGGLSAVAAELLGPAAPPAEERLPSHEARGPVTVELSLSTARARPGASLEARVRLSVPPGWHLIAHEPEAEGLVGLSVSLPGGDLIAASPRYPEATAARGAWGAGRVHQGEPTVSVALRVPRQAPPGPRAVRVSVRFQACDARACADPQSVVLDAPLVVEPR